MPWTPRKRLPRRTLRTESWHQNRAPKKPDRRQRRCGQHLRNQRLPASVFDIGSIIPVDWQVQAAAALCMRAGMVRSARMMVAPGCRQGRVFGPLMDEVDRIRRRFVGNGGAQRLVLLPQRAFALRFDP